MIDPISDSLPEITITGIADPEVVALSLVEAIDASNGSVTIRGVHDITEKTKVQLGDYGVFDVRRYNHYLAPRATTLELHQGIFGGLITSRVIDDFAAAWPKLWEGQKSAGVDIWRRLDKIIRADDIGGSKDQVEDGTRLRDLIMMDLSETIQRGSDDVGAVIDALMPYQIAIRPMQEGTGGISVQLIDLYVPAVDTERPVMPGINPDVELPSDNRNWLTAGIACKYRSQGQNAVDEFVSPDGAEIQTRVDRVVENRAMAQLEVALQRIRGHNNRRSVQFTLPIHGPRLQLYETIRLPELKREIPTIPDVWLVEELDWNWPRDAAAQVQVQVIPKPIAATYPELPPLID